MFPPRANSPAPTTASRSGFLGRLRHSISRGANWLGEWLPGGKIDEALLESLEERLIQGDLGVELAAEMVTGLRKRIDRKEVADTTALEAALRAALLEIIQPVAVPLQCDRAHRPFVVMVVGINGSGKTTTLGKLAARLTGEGRRVMLAACDTFRAAAVEQLATWAGRSDLPLVSQGTGADPAAVAHDALASARARDMDVLLVDTAGRLHTQSHLMDELGKVVRVMRKLDPTAPHEVLLVLDASQGQNALRQAEQFRGAVGVTGLALTKLDGTAKGGIVVAIAKRLGIPIRYVGIGEQPEDFGVFDAEAFVDGLLGQRGSTPP
ncbi:MAG: signal recognition particle-docking protein FtsY [Steroidobacteraceae bacterium]